MSAPLIEHGWVHLECLGCSRPFKAMAGVARAWEPRYCSLACYDRWRGQSARQHPRYYPAPRRRDQSAPRRRRSIWDD